MARAAGMREFVEGRAQARRQAREITAINRHAAKLNAEMKDALSFQAGFDICAPGFSARHGLSTQVALGPGEGLKHDSAIACDALMSIEKSRLTDFVGELSPAKLGELDDALTCALAPPGKG